ncbi:MAG: hypothetical protein M1820_005918 [Bogoriella megaspora]|nr:MAG: hypothetical protein M1820_005918 [Bogoriella megaspora]
MVLWGLTLLTVSLTFVTYRHFDILRDRVSRTLRRGESGYHNTREENGAQSGTQGSDKRDVALGNGKIITQVDGSKETSRDEDSPDTTPKARSAQALSNASIPSFSLNGSPKASDRNNEKFSNGTMPAPPILKPPPNESKPSASELMPPPRIPLPRRTTPSAAQSARVPSTGPLPNRGPVPARTSNNTLGVPAAPTPTLNSRNKVVLAPGRSSIDWAQLTRTNKNLSGVPYMQRVTPSQLKQMNGRKGKPIWASYMGKVYNLTPYVPYHPGGEGEIMRAAGKNAEKLFNEIHSYVNWENMLGQCCVGIVVTENEEQQRGTTDWEAMD